VRRRLLTSNPFADLKAAVMGNAKRLYFITQEEAAKVLDACPDAEWRLIFALSRYGGLRCPSEHLGLKWADVDWERNRILVHSPKTEHHAGGDCRWIPLFPELQPHLLEVFSQPNPGEYVITRYRDTNANLRTQLERIIKKAGLKSWPKPFQNLRSTRETELAETWPEHVVCAWIGNTVAVARKHYLQVTDEHFEQAALKGTGEGEPRQVAQNAAQQTDAQPRNPPHPVSEPAFCDSLQVIAGQYVTNMGDTGLEPVTPCV
jgi:integrase